jgi:multidrug resistance efflux pump
MNIRSKLRLMAGILVVLALAGGLLVYMNYTMSRVPSRIATLASDAISMGVDYPGTLDRLLVKKGDRVKKGDIVMTIHSPSLQSDISAGIIKNQHAGYEMNDENDIVVRAPEAATVQDTMFTEGAFVPAGKEIVTLSRNDHLYVVATYHLTPRDYARIDTTTTLTVTLPNNQRLTGTVADLTIADDNDSKVTETTLRAEIDSHAVNQFAFQPGTPVKTTLRLNGTTFYERISSYIGGLIREIQR